MGLIEFRKNCEKRDHIPLSPDLPIRPKQDLFRFVINGDDYMLNDWYYNYFYLVLNVKKADGTAYDANDVIAVANDTCSLVRKLLVKSNGKEIYEADD